MLSCHNGLLHGPDFSWYSKVVPFLQTNANSVLSSFAFIISLNSQPRFNSSCLLVLSGLFSLTSDCDFSLPLSQELPAMLNAIAKIPLVYIFLIFLYLPKKFYR